MREELKLTQKLRRLKSPLDSPEVLQKRLPLLTNQTALGRSKIRLHSKNLNMLEEEQQQMRQLRRLNRPEYM